MGQNVDLHKFDRVLFQQNQRKRFPNAYIGLRELPRPHPPDFPPQPYSAEGGVGLETPG
jgi:hypothetical protein